MSKNVAPNGKSSSFFISPFKLLESVKNRPTVLSPIIICVVIGLLRVPFSKYYTKVVFFKIADDTIKQNPNALWYIHPLELASQMSERQTVYLIATLAAFVGVPLYILFSAFGLFIVSKFARSTVKFKQYLSMVSHLGIINGLLSAAACVFTALYYSESSQIITNAASAGILMPNGSHANIFYNFLTIISLPRLCFNILIIIGVKLFNNWKLLKSALVGAICFIIAIVLEVCAALLTHGSSFLFFNRV